MCKPPGVQESETAEQTETPAMKASRASWACVQAHDKDGWLALMADDVVIEDPIGEAITNPDGTGVRGKAAVAEFYDKNIAANNLRITCEESFASSDPREVAHVLVLRSEFDGGLRSSVRGVFCYRVDDDGLMTNMRGYWNLDTMEFSQDG